MIKGYVLPLGTVVKLKNGDQELMIMGRAQISSFKGELGYFDYVSVLYPHGATGATDFAFFNDEDVSEVIFEGYRNEQEVEFANSYGENAANTSYPKLQIEEIT